MKGFDVLEKAVKKGFGSVASAVSAPSDTDLRIYENMTPEALNLIAETYGEDGLVRYVTAMEAKRMKKMQQGEQ